MSAATQTTERIVDASREAVLELGVGGTTLSDVARRAGVSRMTIYRRYPDLTALLRDLLTAEFGRLLAEVAVGPDATDARSRLVAEVTGGCRAMRANPVWRKVAADEPALLVPYVFERVGATQEAALGLIRQGIAEGQSDGSVRAGDARALAQGVLLVAQSFVHSAHIADDLDSDRVMDELPVILERYLAPGARD
ncbi:TetR/AcrR family transcriptional regulator [Thermoleophilia bacterium SCSIO 60948]|nr:TetR/AcrR family transcriptional regulator [Thermoleophilia bacterium SCSIO 60948]